MGLFFYGLLKDSFNQFVEIAMVSAYGGLTANLIMTGGKRIATFACGGFALTLRHCIPLQQATSTVF